MQGIFFKKYLPAAFSGLTILGFLCWKLDHLVFRFGDGNAYTYMAQAILNGYWPYRDFFLADPPFLVLLLVPFKVLFGSNLLLFQAVPVIFEAGTAAILALLLKRWKNPLYFLVPLVYLFSFTVLSTSDYLTGVQVVVFFTALGIYLDQLDLSFWSGVSFTLGILIKMYAAPAFLGILAYQLWRRNWRSVLWATVGAAAATLLIWGPFWIAAFHNVAAYSIIHQLNRPAGLNKAYVLQFFWNREWLVLILVLFGAVAAVYKKHTAMLWPFVFTALFFLIFRDLYYAYLDSLYLYLVVFSVGFLGFVWQKFKYGPQVSLSVLAALLLFLMVSFSSYWQDFYTVDRFLNAPEIAQAVSKLPDGFDLYGSHEVAPLVALLANKRLVNNYIDTNTQAFASGGQNLADVSKKAVDKGVYMLARVTDLPQYGIQDFGFGGYFDRSEFSAHCVRALTFPSTSNDQDNTIAVYRCKSGE